MAAKNQDPIWTGCPHLSAGTCPELFGRGPAFDGESSPVPELTQDMALIRLGEACRNCRLAFSEGEQS